MKKSLFLLVIGLYSTCFATVSFGRDSLVIKTSGQEYIYSAEIAETPKQQAQGLMHRPQMGEDEAMLFTQTEPRIVQMWMKNTPIPLDMLFIDSSGKITYIAHNTEPNSLDIISSPEPVKAVLEIKGGMAGARAIRVGDRVIHKVFAK